MTSLSTLRDMISQTYLVDTHEHLLEEGTRLLGAGGHPKVPCTDAALLFHHYADNDLHSSGMPRADRVRLYAPDVAPAAKWALLAPYWPRIRSTGYVQAVRRTVRILFGEDDMNEGSFIRISEQMQSDVKPGWYRYVFERANIASCQVNSFEAIFCESAQPDLLLQDLSITACTVDLRLDLLEAATGIAPTTLDAMETVQDELFTRYAHRAVAVKSQSAYSRRLNYEPTSKDAAEPIFPRIVRGEQVEPGERKLVQDYLMHRALGLATRHRLPVKLHCGYYAGNDAMPLARVSQNAADLCPILAAYPDTTFVLMHIGYPYQDEYIALAKQFRNVHIDLCWAWIINPMATVRFVREFLVAAPASKLFTFGGDYGNVEPIVGHADIARQGLAQALSDLVESGWMPLDEAIELIAPLMHGNAERVFKLTINGPLAPTDAISATP